ncbi:MAG: SIMPL domain-containing protein [Acidobacteriaceae bacterium]|nr:SIMPL domain-containing protein [Acidobacteriaceae bacterium]
MKPTRSCLLLATTALCLAPIRLSAQQQAFKQDPTPRSISITATARVSNGADVATVHIGYIAYGPDKDTAYANGSQLSNSIIEALKKAGIPADSIESQSEEIQATQPYQLEKLSPTEKVARAWQVSQQWTVRVSAAEGARTLDLATKSGANQNGQIDWSLQDPNKANAAAATKALQLAQSQAQAMAAGLNVHLGVLLNASNSVESEPVRPVAAVGRIFAMKADAAPATKPLAINPRQIETTATVSAVFAID